MNDKTMKVKNLPLGTRFSYLGNPNVFVLLHGYGCGVCATETSIEEGLENQRVFSVSNTKEEFEELEVIVHINSRAE